MDQANEKKMDAINALGEGVSTLCPRMCFYFDLVIVWFKFQENIFYPYFVVHF